MREQFLALMPFITKSDAGFDKLLSGGRVVIKIMLILEHCVRSIKELQETTIGEGTKIDNQVHGS
jgi:UDP-3-O-[3-hydroxymyristoyl] glucosamine N-acyltransferase